MTSYAPDEWYEERNRKIREWIPDPQARSFLYDISRITELWDDLYDRDENISPEQIEEAMLAALISLPLNPFYQKHSGYLTPLMLQAINTWKDSNVLAKGTRSQRMLAYALRHLDNQIIIALIYLTQGYAKMREYSVDVWTFLVADVDDGDAWMAAGDKT